MKKSVEIISLPVISISEGRELGMSKGLLINAKEGEIAAIIIEDEDWYRGVKLLPYSSVVAIGEDAVTVINSDTILTLENAGDYETMMDDNVKVIGTKAITKSGTIQGKVVEIYIGEKGKIEKCEIEADDGSLSEITSDQISIFGKQVTIIDSGMEKKTEELTEAPVDSAENTSATVESPAAEHVEEPAEEVIEEKIPEASDTPEVSPEEAEAEMAKEEAEQVPEIETGAEEAAQMEEPAPAPEPEPEPEPEPVPAPEPVAAPDPVHQAANNTTIDRQRKFILGKTARRTLTSPTGVVIVNEGEPITEEVIQRAQLSNMFVPLTLNVQ